MSIQEKQKKDKVVINIDSVSKAFAARWVLKSINLSVNPGVSVCICGVNGAGKSTLLRIVSGLMQPDKGNVSINGYDVVKDPEKTKANLGVISHKNMVYSDLTVFENIKFFATFYGVKNSTVRTEQLLKDVALFPYRYDKTSVLSRGMLQRLSIVRALVHNPTVLLADEPFTGLDSQACRHLVSVLKQFNDNGGTTIMTTHDLTIGLQCCSRVVVIDKTALIFDAKTSDIDTKAFAKDYLNYSRGNK